MLIIFSIVGLAAAEPGSLAHSESVGTSVSDLVVAEDGRWAAFVETGSAQVGIVDTHTWDTSRADPCDAGGVLSTAIWQSGSVSRVFIGCAGGQVAWMDADEDGTIDDNSGSLSLGTGDVVGLVEDEDVIYAVVEDDGSGYLVLTIEAESATAGPSSVEVAAEGFVDVATTGTELILTHGDTDVSRVTIPSLTASRETSSVGGGVSDVIGTGGGGNLIAAGTGGVVRFEEGSSSLTSVISAGTLQDATALHHSIPAGELWVADAGRESFVVYELGASASLPDTASQGEVPFASGGAVSEMGAIDADTTLVGTHNGELWFLTDAPWVVITDAAPLVGTSGDEVLIDFGADRSGSYSVRAGARDNDSGTEVASGILAEDESISVSLFIDDGYVEGNNEVRVVVTDDEGVSGHDAVYVVVDNPPDQVSLSQAAVQWGDETLLLTFKGVSDEDVDHYEVYISGEPFERSDYDSGGPISSQSPASPQTIRSSGPGETESITLTGLKNGRTYYLAVRAFDEGGLEGVMSDVVSGTPLATYSAAEASGEPGGMCAAAPSGGLVLAVLGLLGVGVRRRGWLVGGGALCLSLSVPVAEAGRGNKGLEKYDPSRENGAAELRYGPTFFNDEVLQDHFGDKGHNMLKLEAGPAWFRVLELRAGIGMMRATGYTKTASGASSDEEERLTIYPATLTATVRLDVLEEQWVVPVLSGGADYWLWQEAWAYNLDESLKESTGGGKYGYHTAAGVHLLLDPLDPSRASKAHVRRGIDDSYLVIEYRVQSIGASQDGLDFSGTGWSAGVRVDF